MVKLTWLGHSGFVLQFRDITFYIDPVLAPLNNPDLILCTHAAHIYPDTLLPALAASPHVKIVLPKSAADHARSLGIPFERMTTTDSGLRVEYFKNGLYGRVYSIPSAHPDLDFTPLGGYPYLGYLIRFGEITVYHAGGCRNYAGLADRLKPYRVTVALLPIGPDSFEPAQAAQLAEDIGAPWLVPMAYHDPAPFVDHMLGFRPSIGFKVFAPGEGWTILI